jgi:hypothetical protein
MSERTARLVLGQEAPVHEQGQESRVVHHRSQRQREVSSGPAAPRQVARLGASEEGCGETLARSVAVKQSEAGFVIKYFDLIDEFIRVRSCSEEILQDLLRGAAQEQGHLPPSAWCAPACPASRPRCCRRSGRMDGDYDTEIVEELLYQICIDVNPTLEIHQVSIPGPTLAAAGR